MTRDQALQKIKKCLALGRSAEPAEAAAAMRQAQKLMAEHCVSERDLSMADVREVRTKASSSAGSLWGSRLTKMVAKAFGCETFDSITGGYNAAGNYERSRFVVFVGLESAPEIAAYAFDVLFRQCAKARLAHIARQPRNCKPITKTARGDEFAKGWVYAVRTEVESFAGTAEKSPLLVEYIGQKYPDMQTSTPRDTAAGRKVDGHSSAGYAAGLGVRIARGVGAAAPKGLLT